MCTGPSGGVVSSASDDEVGGFHARVREQTSPFNMRDQDRAPLSWTSERVDTRFRLRVREEGSGSTARSSRAERAIKPCASKQAQTGQLTLGR